MKGEWANFKALEVIFFSFDYHNFMLTLPGSVKDSFDFSIDVYYFWLLKSGSHSADDVTLRHDHLKHANHQSCQPISFDPHSRQFNLSWSD